MEYDSKNIALPLLLRVQENGYNDYEHYSFYHSNSYSRNISFSQLDELLNSDKVPECEDGDLLLVQNAKAVRKIFDSGSKHNSLFITNNCNQGCLICAQPPIICDDYEYYFRLNNKVVELLPKDLSSIGITGGEPTLLGERLFQLLASINELLPDTFIYLLTNGLYFKDYPKISKLQKVDSDRLVLGIPFYSHIPQIHNRIVDSVSYFKLVDALFNLAVNDSRVELRIVITRFNYSHLYDLSKFIYKNFPFVVHVAFMGIELMGYAKTNCDDVWVGTNEYMEELYEAVMFLDMNKFSVSIYHLPLCLLPEDIRKFSRNSITEWKRKLDEKCDDCTAKDKCSGMFRSTYEKYRYEINPI